MVVHGAQLLEQRRAGVQVAFGLMYVAMALTLLLSAIWIGMWFANRLVAPIRRLIGAANIAVAINVGMIFGILSLLNATLTLPGIAGVILTIGWFNRMLDRSTLFGANGFLR